MNLIIATYARMCRVHKICHTVDKIYHTQFYDNYACAGFASVSVNMHTPVCNQTNCLRCASRSLFIHTMSFVYKYSTIL